MSALPGGPLERRTNATIVDRAQLARELEAARERGYATIEDELEVGLAAVASPIHDAAGTVVAALSVAGPTARLTAPRLDVLGRLAIEQALFISTGLGYSALLENIAGAPTRFTPPPPAGRP